MNIRLFNRKYTIRRFSEQKNVRGYFISPFEDFTVSMDVSPSGTDSMKSQPEGQNVVSYLDGWGETELRTSDIRAGTRGDMLWYDDDWYECVSCRKWNHTLLSHFNYHFAMVPRSEPRTGCLEAPAGGDTT